MREEVVGVGVGLGMSIGILVSMGAGVGEGMGVCVGAGRGVEAMEKWRKEYKKGAKRNIRTFGKPKA